MRCSLPRVLLDDDNGDLETGMGLFDDAFNAAKGQVYQSVEGQAQGLIGDAIEKAMPGGLQGLLVKLQTGGLGDQVNSWLSEGHNLPVTQDQLRGALGDVHVQQIASSVGLPVDQLLQGLAEHLPGLADAIPKP